MAKVKGHATRVTVNGIDVSGFARMAEAILQEPEKAPPVPPTPPSLYQVLALSDDATADDIRAQYRALVKRYHPDIPGNKGNAAVRTLFEEVQKAYTMLSDVDKRRKYDAVRKLLADSEAHKRDEYNWNSPSGPGGYTPNLRKSASYYTLNMNNAPSACGGPWGTTMNSAPAGGYVSVNINSFRPAVPPPTITDIIRAIQAEVRAGKIANVSNSNNAINITLHTSSVPIVNPGDVYFVGGLPIGIVKRISVSQGPNNNYVVAELEIFLQATP